MSIPGVCQKKGQTYRRFRVKQTKVLPDGKTKEVWGDVYVKLPDPTDPMFAEELARVNRAPAVELATIVPGSIRALIAEFRPVLAKRTMAVSTREAWKYYLGLIEHEHGKKLVKDLRKSRVFIIRDEMADTPGKANNYLSKLRALFEFAVERDWIASNPVAGVPNLETGEHEPWPSHVIEEALAAADPMLRLAIVSGLCSGQRLSDVICMQHGWHDGRTMEVRSKKTATDAFVQMHPLWLAEIKKVPRKAVTLLYDRFGKPFSGPDRIQERLRRLMHKLGYVDAEEQLLYTFHGLGKNACCYLAELGLDDRTIGAIVGKTPETVRHYAKRARTLMLAKGAGDKIIAGKIGGLVGTKKPRVGNRRA